MRKSNDNEILEIPPIKKSRPAGVIVVAYTGPKFVDALYEKTDGNLINGGVATNIAGDSIDFLQARVDALLRENEALTAAVNHHKKTISSLLKDDTL